MIEKIPAQPNEKTKQMFDFDLDQNSNSCQQLRNA